MRKQKSPKMFRKSDTEITSILPESQTIGQHESMQMIKSTKRYQTLDLKRPKSKRKKRTSQSVDHGLIKGSFKLEKY